MNPWTMMCYRLLAHTTRASLKLRWKKREKKCEEDIFSLLTVRKIMREMFSLSQSCLNRQATVSLSKRLDLDWITWH